MAYKVKVVYKNADGEMVGEHTYSLSEYVNMIKTDLFRVITDVEDVLYVARGGESKDDWGAQINESFNRIKHKLLDKAGDISRLPVTLSYVEDEEPHGSLSQWLADTLGPNKFTKSE